MPPHSRCVLPAGSRPAAAAAPCLSGCFPPLSECETSATAAQRPAFLRRSCRKKCCCHQNPSEQPLVLMGNVVFMSDLAAGWTWLNFSGNSNSLSSFFWASWRKKNNWWFLLFCWISRTHTHVFTLNIHLSPGLKYFLPNNFCNSCNINALIIKIK